MSRWARLQQRIDRTEEAAARSVEAGRLDPRELLRWVTTAELLELEAMLSGPLEENCHHCGSSTCSSRRRVERAPESLSAAEAARAAEIFAAAKERRAAAPPSNRPDDRRTDA